MTGWIGVAIGDVLGIGPEVTLKALAQEAGLDQTHYLLIGDWASLHRLSLNLGLPLRLERSEEASIQSRFVVVDPRPTPLPSALTPGSPAAAEAALVWLSEGAQRCLRHELDALITAPVNKESILRSGKNFVGQTEYLSELAGVDRTAMMLVGTDPYGHSLRVALVTTHIPLKLVPHHLAASRIEDVIWLAAQACQDLGLSRARIGVCGLNPHAGEGGELGDEELRLVTPAIQAARLRGVEVEGPFAADTLFYQAYHGHYDVVVALYHDQGLVPLKMVAFDTGVNWTLGLPFIRTSPDHGTAYDIAGQNRANPSSMLAALRLAKKLAQRRG